MTTVPLDVLREMLETEGIESVVKNRALSVTAGEVPPIETWPSLWVIDDARADEAERLVKAVMHDDTPGESWTCPGCGETIDGHFAACWRCARSEEDRGDGDVVVRETARDYTSLGVRTLPLAQLFWVAVALAVLYWIFRGA